MQHDRICSWLGLSPGEWPPDHYRLLGLVPGENNLETIEVEVCRRMETVRRYQLTHPEPATDAMNRLAQAMICLTDREAKASYDRRLLGEAVAVTGLLDAPGHHEARDPLAWLLDPVSALDADMPVSEAMQQTKVDFDTSVGKEAVVVPDSATRPATPSKSGTDSQAIRLLDSAVLNPQNPPAVVVPEIPTAPLQDDDDPLVRAAQRSLVARRGLGSKRALYQRISSTRKLLGAWQGAGKYLGRPSWRVARPSEAACLVRQLSEIKTCLKDFPPLLGNAGQPGYLVAALARQQVIVPTFQALLPGQRDALARDWRSGEKVLSAHFRFLRRELRHMRRRSALRRGLRGAGNFLARRPAVLLFLIGLVALNLAYWRSYVVKDWKNHLRHEAAAAQRP